MVSFFNRNTNCNDIGLTASGNTSNSNDKSVDAVVYLVVESMKSGLKTSDLNDCLKSLNIGSDDLIKWYDVNQSYVRNLLLKKSEARSGIPSYRNVEWRLEAQIASRTMVNQLDPRIIVRLELSNGTHDLILTPANLIHMKEVLEEALSSSRSVHVQKLLRHVK